MEEIRRLSRTRNNDVNIEENSSPTAERPMAVDHSKVMTKTGLKWKTLLAATCGILLALAFPKFECFYLVLVAFVPLFFALQSEKGKRAFFLGFVAGLFFYFISLFWITEAMSNFSDLGFLGSVLILLILVAYLSLFVGAFANIVAMARHSNWSVLLIPVFWVSLEFIKSRILSGFPWNNLSWSLYRQTVFIQIADIAGDYGISFCIVLINWLLFLMLARLVRMRAGLGYAHIIISLILLFASTWGYGTYRLSNLDESGKKLSVGIVQPNIPQAMKLRANSLPHMLSIYGQLAVALPADVLDLIVLPEAAITTAYNDCEWSQLWVKRTFGGLCPVLFGAVASTNGDYRNSAFLVDKSGGTSRYDKVHLVPFGEYNPFPRLLHFVEAMAGYEGSLTMGEGHSTLQLGALSIGVPICYEIIFPEISRDFVANGADIICTMSNDAWFGRTSGPYQHFAVCVLRAIENRVPVLRCANSGVSGLVDSGGRIKLETAIFARRADVVSVQTAGNKGSSQRATGLFAYLCLAVSIVVGLGRVEGIARAVRRPLRRFANSFRARDK